MGEAQGSELELLSDGCALLLLGGAPLHGSLVVTDRPAESA